MAELFNVTNKYQFTNKVVNTLFIPSYKKINKDISLLVDKNHTILQTEPSIYGYWYKGNLFCKGTNRKCQPIDDSLKEEAERIYQDLLKIKKERKQLKMYFSLLYQKSFSWMDIRNQTPDCLVNYIDNSFMKIPRSTSIDHSMLKESDWSKFNTLVKFYSMTYLLYG